MHLTWKIANKSKRNFKKYTLRENEKNVNIKKNYHTQFKLVPKRDTWVTFQQLTADSFSPTFIRFSHRSMFRSWHSSSSVPFLSFPFWFLTPLRWRADVDDVSFLSFLDYGVNSASRSWRCVGVFYTRDANPPAHTHMYKTIYKFLWAGKAWMDR